MELPRTVSHVGLDNHRTFSRITGRDPCGRVVLRRRWEHGDRAKLRAFDACRQLHALEPFGDKLPGAVDAGVVVECRHYLREAELGDGADVLQPGQATDGQLDGYGDLLLRFLRAERRHAGIRARTPARQMGIRLR